MGRRDAQAQAQGQAQGQVHLKSLLRASIVVVLVATMGVACTKKKQERNMVSPKAYVAKSELLGQTFHLSRGVEEADSENTVGAVPGMSDDFGLVQARITEDELQLLSVFHPRGRAETAAVIASFPITDHFDIKREENDFKEQTHRIVEDREKPWHQRQYIRVDWSRPSNSLSRFTSASLGDESLREENTILLEDLKNENGHLSWVVETSVKGDRLFKFTPPFSFELIPAFRVTYRTHLMPKKPSDFKPVQYSLQDFSRFGYFFTQQNWEDPEKGFLDSGIKTYANVFNVCEAGRAESCSTNKIVWALNADFPEKYLAGARQAVKEWNNVFKQALGRTDDVVVLNETTRVAISDPRHNVIALYPHKAGGGLLGVAQGVENPETGEKISVRATVYEDGIRYVLSEVDTLIDLIASEDPIRDVIKTAALGGDPVYESPFRNPSERKLQQVKSKVLGVDKIRSSLAATGGNARLAIEAVKPRFTGSADAATLRKARFAGKVPEVFAVPELAKVKGALGADPRPLNAKAGMKVPDLGGMERLLFAQEQIKANKARLLKEAKEGIHGAELVQEASVRYLMRLLQQGATPQDLKSQKARIKEEIAQLTFYTTLLHEMGHTFGLRHNFEGSADKKHYHPEYHRLSQVVEQETQAIQAGKLTPEKRTVHPADLEPYAYSSIMDYGADFYSQHGGLGEYDKAAIKYGYNRSVQRDTDPVTQAGFRFCTDHQADETILCRRFDKGSNVTEVTYNTIERFQRSWALSHFRRDRANFDRYTFGTFLSMLQYTMIPVRQVMDEFVYSLISAEMVDVGSRTGGLCDMKFVRASVDRQEMGDVCDPLKAEQVGVNLTDLETLYESLFSPQTGGLRADPSKYLPYGMADLLMANLLAQGFFQDVIGSTEPGVYLALPPQQRGAPHTLMVLDRTLPTDEARLRAFAQDQGIEGADADKFVEQAKPFVTEVKVGRVGKPFTSQGSTIGGFTRLQNIGAFWDKYAAIIALSTRDLGVSKYSEVVALAGNAYVFPQTKRFATRMFDRLITGESMITAAPVTLRGGQVVQAAVPASLNVDTQILSTFVALTDLSTDLDTSMTDKLRICNVNEAQCERGSGRDVVQFTSTNAGDVFKAAQTFEGDSIAFNLVAQAKQAADERDKWLEIANKSADAHADALMKLDEASQVLARIDSNLGKLADLAPLREQLTATGPQAKSAWATLVVITQRIREVPLFTTLQLVQQIAGAFGQASQLVNQKLGEMGEKGVCQEAAAANCSQSAEAIRRLALEEIKKDLGNVSTVLQSVIESNANSKIAPIRVQRATSDLAAKEAQIRLIRRFMKETGGL